MAGTDSSVKGIVTLAVLLAAAAGLLTVIDSATKQRVQANLSMKKHRAVGDLTGLEGPFPNADFVLCNNDIAIIRAAARGYGGAMELAIRFSLDGKLQGVRVPVHHETPGYADVLDPTHWLGLFGRNPTSEINAVSGATVTSNTVLDAIAIDDARLTSLVASCRP